MNILGRLHEAACANGLEFMKSSNTVRVPDAIDHSGETQSPVFPTADSRAWPASLAEVIACSEQQLRQANRQREKSPAIDYAPFVLKPARG